MLPYRKFCLWGLVALGYVLVSPSVFAKTLRVGTNPLPPLVFVKSTQEQPVGYSIELWDKVARQLKVEYEFVVFDSTAELLEAVKLGNVDVGISGITITSDREQYLDFSQSYYETGLQILILDQPKHPILAFFQYFISWTTLQALGVLLVVSLAIAHLVWFFEHRSNPQMFAKSYLLGIWEAFWWAIVTAATVGYGDRVPKGFIGRLIALFWMLFGIFIFAYFTASITANKIQEQISGPKDLDGKRVAVIGGTTSASYMQTRPVKLVRFKRWQQAYEALNAGEVDAVVGDAPTLRYEAARTPEFRVVGRLFNQQDYGIALPTGSTYRKPINIILLKLKEQEDLKVLAQKWFPDNE
ncbi:transporter substrate-binding domain-containing protein [Aerosakkonema funiforme]|uniref:transporter substrate-binding domain-containing protein n=1 Tax=Aerosakkonema funiforme TaxID=1246630 RepID=UPI001686FFEA|nr:transporter substrate-binding domain-containing protein [Aerosakkonema funiforme]